MVCNKAPCQKGCSCLEEAWGDERSREEEPQVELSEGVGVKAEGGGRSPQEQELLCWEEQGQVLWIAIETKNSN